MDMFTDQSAFEQFPQLFLQKADRYISALSPAAKQLVTEHKLGVAIGELDFQLCRHLLEVCAEQGLARKRYAVCCPFCTSMLYRQDSPELQPTVPDGEEEIYCQYCDQTYSRNLLMQKDVRTIFDFSQEVS